MRVSTPGRQCSISPAVLTFIALNPFVLLVLPEEQTPAFHASGVMQMLESDR
jgi:hypothetical protein